MKKQNIQTRLLANGLTLVVEQMSDVQSAAFSFMIPCGSIYDPVGENGTASILCDLMTRGAASMDSKEVLTKIENLGIQHTESVGMQHLVFSGATLAQNVLPALEIYADIIMRPLLPAEQFDAARMSVEQTLRANEDEPRNKIMTELRRRCYPAPWGRPAEGTLEDLASITINGVNTFYEKHARPNEAILGVAGNVDIDEVTDTVEKLFGNWQEQPSPEIQIGPTGKRHDHISHESTQTQIGIAYDSVPYRDPNYYTAWAAVSILSGGMSARLFTEVREKRGLCYSVHASLNSLRDYGRVLCYAGTTAERAQETLDVTLAELVRLQEGIEEDELTRCKARAKSSLIMQQESTSARSSSIARDWYLLQRVTTLDEIRERIDALTVDSVLDYVKRHPARDFTILTLGPAPLKIAETGGSL